MRIRVEFPGKLLFQRVKLPRNRGNSKNLFLHLDVWEGLPSLFISQTHVELFGSGNTEYAFEVENVTPNGFGLNLIGSDKTEIGDCALLWLAIHPSIVEDQVLPLKNID